MELTATTAERVPEAPVLLTGAGGGVGCSLAQWLLENGRRSLLFHYRRRARDIRAVLEKFDLDPERALYQADLTDETQVARMHQCIRETHGPLYGLINLAGGSTNGLSWKLTADQFRETLDANLLTAFLCSREFIPEMREAGRGRIINISSVVAFTGAAGASHYCAAKAGIIGLTKALALELASKNVVVSAVALGYLQYGLIHSIPPEIQEQLRNRIPARRFGGCHELGGLVLYLLSEGGAYSGGQVYHLNGGLYS